MNTVTRHGGDARTLSVQEMECQTGLGAPTLRYYEQVGLIGPIERDESSGHRRYTEGA